jgi:hypothetical protein
VTQPSIKGVSLVQTLPKKQPLILDFVGEVFEIKKQPLILDCVREVF